MAQPASAASCMICLAVSCRSGSFKDLPIFTPLAARKVLAMAPPIDERVNLTD